MAQIEKFWVVTMPARRSTIGDICFETDWLGLENQFRGGLKAEDIRAQVRISGWAHPSATESAS